MKLHTHEEMLDAVIGKKGTTARNEFDAKLKAEIDSYQIGAAEPHPKAAGRTHGGAGGANLKD